MEHLPQQYRHLFPTLQTHTMLASCSQSALAEPVSRAIQDYHDSLLYKGTNWKEAIEKTEFARNEFAKLIGLNRMKWRLCRQFLMRWFL